MSDDSMRGLPLDGNVGVDLFAQRQLDTEGASRLAGTAIAEWLRWAGEWTAGRAYKRNDVVRDGQWSMVCQTDDPLGTFERAAPVADGDAFDVYDGSMLTTQVVAKQVAFGNQYTFAEGAWVSGVRVYVIAGNDYQVYGGTSDDVAQLASFTASSTGWSLVPVLSDELVTPGAEFAVVAVVSEPDPTPTETVAAYDYVAPNNPSVPLAGQASHANNLQSVIRFDKSDNGGTDRSALLLSLDPGDVISTAAGDWSVQGVSDDGSYVSIIVAPSSQQGAVGVRDFTFETTTATPITFGEDVDYWLGNTSVRGLLAVDGGLADLVETDDAYGIDIEVQPARLPTVWEVLAYSGSSTSGSGGAGFANFFAFEKASGIVDIGDVYEPVATLSVPSLDAGTFMLGASLTYTFTSISTSVFTRWRVDGGSWNESIRESKDTTDKFTDYYAYPSVRSAGPLTIEFEARKESATGTLNIDFLDLFVERVA